jgi:hypothetical protein
VLGVAGEQSQDHLQAAAPGAQQRGPGVRVDLAGGQFRGDRVAGLGGGGEVLAGAGDLVLQAGDAVGGAALDVFTDEPLAPGSPWWELPNVIVSPHMSGDFRGWEQALTGLFLDQLRRYQAGQPLVNVVDKRLGFVAPR